MSLALPVTPSVRPTPRGRRVVRDIVSPTVRRPPTEEPASAERLLTALAHERDRAAFVALFEMYGPRVKGFLLSRGADGSVADDLVQEVMLRVWRSAGLFDPSRGTASTWIFTVARNCFLDHVRRTKRPEPSADELARVGGDDAQIPSTEDTLAAAESAAAVRQALATLPDEQGQVIEDAYFSGLSLAEIACARQLPLGTVKSRARLALSRLRALLSAPLGLAPMAPAPDIDSKHNRNG